MKQLASRKSARRKPKAGLDEPEAYACFDKRIFEVRRSFQGFLDELKRKGKRIAAYGAAAKGNTFLNFCGVTASDISFVADRSTIKLGKLLPGSHIPVRAPASIETEKPDYVLILP